MDRLRKLFTIELDIPGILILWFTGGILYFYMEILNRGYSHVSMFICAGICFVCIGAIGEKWLWEKTTIKGLYVVFVTGAVITSTLEFVTGVIVNLVFDWDVWDYSELKFNLFGQICPTYTCLWGLLSIPAVYLYMLVKKKIFLEK